MICPGNSTTCELCFINSTKYAKYAFFSGEQHGFAFPVPVVTDNPSLGCAGGYRGRGLRLQQVLSETAFGEPTGSDGISSAQCRLVRNSFGVISQQLVSQFPAITAPTDAIRYRG
jgi:hypothetical protein